jgi:hypothetical protein
MSKRIVTFGLLALGGALGGVWWLRRGAGPWWRRVSWRLPCTTRLGNTCPTRRERYLASLEREVLEDGAPTIG